MRGWHIDSFTPGNLDFNSKLYIFIFLLDLYTIIGSVAGSLLIVVIIVVVIGMKYRQHRARYGQHDILLNNDDDSDPIDIET